MNESKLELTESQLFDHADSSYKGIERQLNLCRVPIHEQNEILQMVIAHANYKVKAVLKQINHK